MDLGALVRRLVAGPSGAGGAAAPGGSGPAPASGSPLEPLARPAWRDAAPIQRVVGSAPLVAPNAAFSARLATNRPAPLALASLGHDRGLEAPAGLVSGIAAPVQRSPSSPVPASVRPAHDSLPGRHPAVQRTAGGEAWPDEAATPDAPAADAGFAADAVALGDGSAAAAASASPAPAVAPSSPPVAAPSPLLTAPSPVTGLVGLIGPAAVASGPRPPSAAASASPSSPAPVVARQLAGETSLATAAGSSASSEATGATAIASTPVADRPVRRIRLGAPLTPTVSRLAVPGSPAAGPASGPAPFGAAPAASSVSPAAAGVSAPGPTAPGGSGSAPEGVATLARSAAGASAPGAPEPQASPAETAPSPLSPALPRLQRSAEPTLARSPLVGGLRPMLTAASSAISVSRRAAAPGTEADAEGAGAQSSADALAALGRPDWGAAGTGWATGLPDAATTAGASVAGPGSPFAIEPGAGGIAPARLTWTNPLADPSAPTTPGAPDSGPASAPAPWPGAATGAGPADTAGMASALASAPSAPPSASSAPTVSRSVASRPAAARGGLRVGPAMSAAIPGGTGRPAGQSPARSSSAWASATPAGGRGSQDPVVSRAVTIDEVEVTPDPSAASAESGAAAGASGQAASGGAGAPSAAAASAAGTAGSEAARDQETQAWADRLYDRISLRLRRDLLVERERSGALVDRGF